MKDPTMLVNFNEILAEYNKMLDKNFHFHDTRSGECPPDFVCHYTRTRDWGGLWIMRGVNESDSVENNVFVKEPHPGHILRSLKKMPSRDVEVFFTGNFSGLSNSMYVALCDEWWRLEDIKNSNAGSPD